MDLVLGFQILPPLSHLKEGQSPEQGSFFLSLKKKKCLLFFYCGVVDLCSHVSFKYTAKWFTYTYIYNVCFSDSFQL